MEYALTNHSQAGWDVLSPHAWGDALGLVDVPLFGREHPTSGDFNFAVLLDGQTASTAITNAPLDASEDILSWSWSAHLRHTLLLQEDRVVYRRWDAPGMERQLRLPRSPAAASDLFSHIQNQRPNALPDVITAVLRAFRIVRANTAQYGCTAAESVRVFNAFLAGTEAARERRIDTSRWLQAFYLREAFDTLSEEFPEFREGAYGQLASSMGNLALGDLIQELYDPDPFTKYRLDPDLLIRHAAGYLYQEAHFVLEREQIVYLPGMAPARTGGTPQRDARFTPPSLARAIVQQTFDSVTDLASRDCIRIVDPACGSGVFLAEALRELCRRKFHGRLMLDGFDLSETACAVSEFCLQRAKADAGPLGERTTLSVRQCDALLAEWGPTDVVVMNPPFVSWTMLSAEERDIVSDVLGKSARGRPDMAMAFMWKAAQSLRAGGAMGTIIPSGLLDNQSGASWRERLTDRLLLRWVGRFRNYDFFPGALVQPAFVVASSREAAGALDADVRVVIAGSGATDSALRAMRLKSRGLPVVDDRVEVSTRPRDQFTTLSWLPRPAKQEALVRELGSDRISTVAQMFKVHQGVKTGLNDAFVVTPDWLERLPKAERRFFRPASGAGSIISGMLLKNEYIFYPYDRNGPVIDSEESLRAKVPVYYEDHLSRFKPELMKRMKSDPERWWNLLWERQWQWERTAKLLSTTFGAMGSFAYDPSGEFICLQGNGWIPRDPDSFRGGVIPWAYVAILNSPVFEAILSCFCPTVQGGQFELAARFIGNAFLPDLRDERVSPDRTRALARFGHSIATGTPVDVEALSNLVAAAYGRHRSAFDFGEV